MTAAPRETGDALRTDAMTNYRREAYQRFFAHNVEPWPDATDAEHDRAIALASAIDSLEAERQQRGMTPSMFRVRMHKLLLGSKP